MNNAMTGIRQTAMAAQALAASNPAIAVPPRVAHPFAEMQWSRALKFATTAIS
jgi:hypothetical protein